MMRRLNLEEFEFQKDKLLTFSHLGEKDIWKIWSEPGDDQISDFSSLEYRFDAPLYQKMIFRYRDSSSQAAPFWYGCDRDNKRKMLERFGLYTMDTRLPISMVISLSDQEFDILSKEYIRDDGHLIEFLAWIVNMLGPCDIFHLEGLPDNLLFPQCIEQSKYYPLWRQNGIEFFFSLLIDKRQALIDQYNQKEVDEYNKMINKDYLNFSMNMGINNDKDD